MSTFNLTDGALRRANTRRLQPSQPSQVGVAALLGLLACLAAPACAVPASPAEGTSEAFATTEAALAAVAPTLYRYTRTDGTSEYAVGFPQPDLTMRSFRIARGLGCDETFLRNAFGVDVTVNDVPDVDGLPTLACPDTLAADARVFVEPRTTGVSRIENRTGAVDPTSALSEYLAVPNSCAGLLSYFQIPTRANRQWLSVGAQPPEAATEVYLSCGKPRRKPPTSGWAVRVAWAFVLDTPSTLFLLEKGPARVYIDAVDGRRVGAMTEAEQVAAITTLAASLGAEAGGFGDFDAPDLETLTRGPLVDICASADTCDAPSWVPMHKKVDVTTNSIVCLDGTAIGDTGCKAAARLAVRQSFQLDGTFARAVDTAAGTIGLATCEGDTWERRLGIDVLPPANASWLARWSAAYERSVGLAPNEPAPAARWSCLHPPPPCSVSVPDGADLSTFVLPSAVLSKCRRNAAALLEVVLPRTARVSGRPFAVSAGNFWKGLTTVRIVGALDGTSNLNVGAPTCAGTGACAAPVSVFAFEGGLRVELANLNILPELVLSTGTPSPTDGPTKPLARTIVSAKGTTAAPLELLVRNVHVGNGTSSSFYKGIDTSLADVTLVSSDIRAFTDAVRVQAGTLAAISAAPEAPNVIASLSQSDLFEPRTKPVGSFLRDLGGQSLAGTVQNFRAITLGQGSQGFVANMKVSGPLGIAWASDRPAEAEDGFVAWQTSFANDAGYFQNESVVLQVGGRGSLRFHRPSVDNVGQVVSCPDDPTWFGAHAPRVTFDHAPLFGEAIAHTKREGEGSCAVETPFEWGPRGSFP